MGDAKILILTKARGTAPGGAGTLTLALSHQGRGDALVPIRAWHPVAGLVARLWIPAFAGMTVSTKQPPPTNHRPLTTSH